MTPEPTADLTPALAYIAANPTLSATIARLHAQRHSVTMQGVALTVAAALHPADEDAARAVSRALYQHLNDPELALE
ncbi:hypothetical protein [Deinococcus kurensis]|uniref:hypothetical protein n=1 Tax=Deinococcus kurensis TaxID=2662757 RepID=UPI0012D3298E|nr:hypothetical protein [Deinococcus kurensis]